MTDDRSQAIPWHALRHKHFRRMWLAQGLSLIGSQMQVVAINWHVYLITGSALALGFVGLTRVLPIIGFSLLGGVVADRSDRRRVMFAAQCVMTVVACGLALATAWGRDGLWAIYALNALSASATAFDGPSRQALIPRLVPDRDLPGALSLNLTAFHAAMIGGPSLAGLLLAGGSFAFGGSQPSGTDVATMTPGAHATLALLYGLNALSFLFVLATLALLPKEAGRVEPGAQADAHPVRALKEGLRFVFSTPLMVWTMALDFFATFFSGAMSLLPIVADQILGIGAGGYGLLVSAPGIGALIGSLYTSLRPLPNRQGRIFLWAVAAYGLCTIVFGLSRSTLLTFLALAGTGLADLVSTVIRSTLRQLITPDGLRGRMTSINMIFFMGGPQLGELEAGLLASLFASAAVGASVSIVVGGVATIAIVGVVAGATPLVRRYDLREHLARSRAA